MAVVSVAAWVSAVVAVGAEIAEKFEDTSVSGSIDSSISNSVHRGEAYLAAGKVIWWK